MIIGCDVDGVLAEFVAPYITLLNGMQGVQLPVASDTYPPSWNFHRDAGIHPDDIEASWRHITGGRFFWNLPPMPMACLALATLKRFELNGHAVYFITARPGQSAKEQTEDWLDVYGFQRPTVIITDDKGPVAKALNLDVFIDDKPEHCISVAAYAPDCQVFMPMQPYNQGLTLPRNVTYVKNALAALEGLDVTDQRWAA